MSYSHPILLNRRTRDLGDPGRTPHAAPGTLAQAGACGVAPVRWLLRARAARDLGAILKWAGNGRENTRIDIPMPEMSVSVVAGVGLEPTTFGL